MDKDEQDFEFFTRAKEVIDSCMELITTAYCETGESPDFYEYDYHTNGDAMALTILYFMAINFGKHLVHFEENKLYFLNL